MYANLSLHLFVKKVRVRLIGSFDWLYTLIRLQKMAMFRQLQKAISKQPYLINLFEIDTTSRVDFKRPFLIALFEIAIFPNALPCLKLRFFRTPCPV